MSNKTELEYNLRDDIIFGFEDLGPLGRTNKTASSVLLLMIRGINVNWKQCVGYLAGHVKGKELCIILKDTISKLIDIGFEVVGVTCDQGGNNRLCLKLLGSSTENPYFFVNGTKILTFFDVPHLFKSLRNSLYLNDIIVEGKRVSWDIIRKVYEFDNGTIRAMYKLSDVHIDPKNFNRMSVKLATHILSHSVAAAIFTAVSLDCFKEPLEKECAINPATFISRLNTLFDQLNSVSKFSKNPGRNALSKENINMVHNLQEVKTWILTWMHKGRMKRPYCFDGVIRTINAVEILWQYLQTKQKYLITGHLNQDPIENMISMIRNFKGTYETNPSTYRVYRNLKQIMFHNYFTSDLTSYEDAQSENLMTVTDLSRKDTNDSVSFEENCIDDEDISINLISNVMGDIFENNSSEEKFKINSMVYFYGYIAKKISTSAKCNDCEKHMISCDEKYSEKYCFIKNKAYKFTKEDKIYGSLMIPTAEFEAELNLIFCKFLELFENYKEKENLIQNYIFPPINKIIPQWPGCDHKPSAIRNIIVIMTRIKIRDFNKKVKNTLKSQRINILRGTE